MQFHRLVGASLLTSLVACATEPSTCADTAARLTACSDTQREAFVAACEEAGPDADPASFGDADEACAAPVADGKEDAATSALTALCVTGMYAVKWGVAAMSPPATPLSDTLKTQLRPLYGSLVDTAKITYAAQLPPRIVVAGHEISVQPDAMTFGDHIYLAPSVSAAKNPAYALLTVVHEMTHVKQASDRGGYYGFAVQYCRDMRAVDYKYSAIPLEVAAYAVEHDAYQALRSCHKVKCP